MYRTLRVYDGEVDSWRLEKFTESVEVRLSVAGGDVYGGTERTRALAAALIDLRVHRGASLDQKTY